MRYVTDRKLAQGLGAGRSGTQHHWHMMIRSAALVVLVPLFVFTFGIALGRGHEEVVAFFSKPFPAILTALMLIVGVMHFTAEAKEAVEDYVHGLAGKLTLIALDAFSYTLIAAGMFALAKLAL